MHLSYLRDMIARDSHSLKEKNYLLKTVDLRCYWQEITKSLSLALPLPSFPLQLQAFLLPSLACREDQTPVYGNKKYI